MSPNMLGDVSMVTPREQEFFEFPAISHWNKSSIHPSINILLSFVELNLQVEKIILLNDSTLRYKSFSSNARQNFYRIIYLLN